MIEVLSQEEFEASFKDKAFVGTIDIEEEKRKEITRREKEIKVALVGNPNCGKTSLFNIISHSTEHVGNYSGVTVEAKEGRFEFQGYHFTLVDLPGTYCLATAYTQSIDEVNGKGEPQTSIHEIPAEMRGGSKYICLPIAMSGARFLSEDGKKLILNIMSYLLSDEPAELDLPFLEISAFSIEGFDAQINQAENTIELAMDAEEFKDMDSLRSVQPEITLADPDYSHVYPNEEVDLRFCPYVPKTFVVTDYISRRAYTFSIRLWRKEGIDQTEDETAPVRKEWQNGQIVIIRGNNKYTITGIKIQ
jgi:hypothetical protein